ncbi:hypothetical protein ARMGADRAFT_1038193 [Armillaria gallica]|uniref:Uncharacterized protein n=1 Tax=Armillaria gallica TaxID=47427 RepID=A0A2H3CX44_ARMGA|nr:hypothetical protein ARMGADRAFT_1038193 [Armillaria gallica]
MSAAKLGQLEAVSKNPSGTVLDVLFNGGEKLNDISKPKPWEALNVMFIPLLSNNESFKAYQGLPKTVTKDKLAPPYIVIIELTGEIQDILLCQRVLTLNNNLAFHIVLADCEVLSCAVWLFKANKPIIAGSAEEIAKIGCCLQFIILQDLWEWKSLQDHIRKKMVKNSNINIMPALTRSGNLYCTICKLDTHPTFDCSFTRDNPIFQCPTKALVGGHYREQQGSGSCGGGHGNRGWGGCPGWNRRAGCYTRGSRTHY